MVVANNLNSVIESMLGDIHYSVDSNPGKLYPFKVRVGCVKRRPPRHVFFEYALEMGRLYIERILDGSSLDGAKELTFIFPERWMNVAEQQKFMYAMLKHPEAGTIKKVDIITSSPLLISNFFREQIRILTWDDDGDYDKEY
jgi:hypothetical protein